jgi:uncharacterized membrane protein YccC
MVETLLYMAIGFLAAALLAIGLVPLIHKRAERLTLRRIENGLPFSMAEVHAEKDALRAEFALSMRRLEMRNARLIARLAQLMAEVSKKDDQLRILRTQTPRAGIYAPSRRRRSGTDAPEQRDAA